MAIFTVFCLFNKRKGERHSVRFCNLISWSVSLSHQVCFWLIFHQRTNKKQKNFQHLLQKTSLSFMVCVWRILQCTRFHSFIMCKQSVLVHKIMPQFSSVQWLSRVRPFATLGIAQHQASLSITNPQSSLRLMSIKSVMPFSHLILCRPLLLVPQILPSIRVFSNESTLRMQWPKYWSVSFSIIPSKEIPGLISFRMDWLDLLAQA